MKRMFVRALGLALSGMVFLSAGAAEQPLFTSEMEQAGLVSIGNTQRIHKAIDKARAGEEVTVAFIGGSITEGALAVPQETGCYAALAAQHFAARFMPDAQQLRYINAGISGTPSLLGVTRSYDDVIAHAPDVVFVEFAVNDANDADAQMAYESLVRRLLESESQPAVVLIFTVLHNGYTAQPHMQKIGAHYDLGMISVSDAITPQLKAGNMKWEDYSSDYAHPNNEGHAFIARMIDRLYAAAADTPAQPHTIPQEPVCSADLARLVNLRKGDPAIVSEGSFPSAAGRCYTYNKGWRHWGNRGGSEPFVFTTNASVITLVNRQENNKKCGSAEVYVDGVLRTTLRGHDEKAWGYPVTQLLRIGKGPHTIEIRMAEGDEDKDFILLDVGLGGY